MSRPAKLDLERYVLPWLERIADDASRQTQEAAEYVRTTYVLPLCRRRHWTFSSGMGVWAFYGQDGHAIDDDRLPAGVRAMLDAETHCGLTLGEYMNAVNAEEVTP
jgi:hypothetical protein